MRNSITLALALVFSMLLAATDCVWAVPVTGGTGPGGFEQIGTSSALRLWLDAAKGVTEVSGNVSQWADQSGNSNNATQAVAAEMPLLLGPTINNRPILRFTNTVGPIGDNMNFATFTNPASNYTAFFAIEPGATQERVERTYLFDSSVGRLILAWHALSGGSGNPSPSHGFYDGVWSSVDHNTFPTSAGPQVVEFVMDSTNGVSIFNDGTNQPVTVGGNAYTQRAIGGIIGISDQGGSTTAFNGDYAEMIMYNRVLNSTERQIVENYLSAKFDLTTANDLYSGDDPGNGDYDSDVFGIGRTSVTSELASSGSAGFGIEAISGLDDGDFMLAGHKVESNTELDSRWDRTWYLDNQLDGDEVLNLAFDWSDADLGTANPDFIELLYSSTDGGPFQTVAVSSLAGDTVTFNNLLASVLVDGYYTLGVVPVPEPSSFLLLGLGAMGLVRHTRRCRRRA